MKTNLSSIVSAIVMFIITAGPLCACDFSIKGKSGVTLYYTITNPKKNEVSVSAYCETMKRSETPDVKHGTVLEIPEMVMSGGKMYKVTSIEDEAFADLEGLSEVWLPASLKSIGEEAFAWCMNIHSIVFPAHQVEIGENAFIHCYSIESVSFGSNWKSIDLSWFEDSDTLSLVYIPASVTKISNANSVWSLCMLEVDRNNRTFESYDGMLFSKGLKTLYACPREKEGRIVLPESVENIYRDAFRGCDRIVSVELPSTLHRLDFDLFEDCRRLDSLTIKSGVTFFTGKTGLSKQPVFALALPMDTKVYVPSKLLKAYRSILFGKEGYYCTNDWEYAPEVYYAEYELLQKNQLLAIR